MEWFLNDYTSPSPKEMTVSLLLQRKVKYKKNFRINIYFTLMLIEHTVYVIKKNVINKYPKTNNKIDGFNINKSTYYLFINYCTYNFARNCIVFSQLCWRYWFKTEFMKLSYQCSILVSRMGIYTRYSPLALINTVTASVVN